MDPAVVAGIGERGTVTRVTDLAPTLTALGVAPTSVRELSDLASTGPGRLVILRAPAGVDAPAIAEAVALASLRDPETKRLDVHLALPEGDRWAIGEVDDLVIGPSRVRPFERAHVVVADAEQMAPAAHDHLLKTVEEPSADTTFWFCVTGAAELPATMRGRAAHDLTIQMESMEVLAEGLAASADLPVDRAVEVLRWADGDMATALGCVLAGRVPALERLGTAQWSTTRPTKSSDEVLLAAAEVAIARAAHLASIEGGRKKKAAAAPTQRGKLPRLDTKKLTPADRTFVRRRVRSLLGRWTAELQGEVRKASTRTELARVEARLVALHDARVNMAMNAPLATVLAAALAKMNT